MDGRFRINVKDKRPRLLTLFWSEVFTAHLDGRCPVHLAEQFAELAVLKLVFHSPGEDILDGPSTLEDLMEHAGFLCCVQGTLP